MRSILRSLAAVLLMGGLAPPVALSQPACAQTAGSARAGVVVRFEDGNEDSRCITFEGDGREGDAEGISGIAALRTTGLSIVTKDFGGELGEAVCKIGEVGTDDCSFDAGFWHYLHGTPDGGWEAAQMGPTSYRVHDGDVEGWSWTPANSEGIEPGAGASLEEICAVGAGAEDEPRDEPRSLLPWLLVGAAAATLAVVLVALFRRGRSP